MIFAHFWVLDSHQQPGNYYKTRLLEIYGGFLILPGFTIT